MAKALYGHVGAAPDRRLLDEVTRLRSRVQALEFEITRMPITSEQKWKYELYNHRTNQASLIVYQFPTETTVPIHNMGSSIF